MKPLEELEALLSQLGGALIPRDYFTLRNIVILLQQDSLHPNIFWGIRERSVPCLKDSLLRTGNYFDKPGVQESFEKAINLVEQLVSYENESLHSR